MAWFSGHMLRAMESLKSSSAGENGSAGWAPFALGFRPLFLLAGLSAVLLMSLWPMVWRGWLAVPAYYNAVAWHGHEMLFGYSAAVIAGFLLTAVRNWTGIDTWSGPKLAMLALVWLLGRLLPWVTLVPPAWIAVVDVAFLVLVALSLIRPLWLGQNKVNRVFFFLLLAMALANLISHLQLMGIALTFGDARWVMIELILLLIVLVAGRVLPFFTQAVLPSFMPKRRPWVEIASFSIIIMIIVLELLPVLPTFAVAVLWVLFGLVQTYRLSDWLDWRVFKMPVLWVLHTAYAWLALGALLNGLAMMELFAPMLALHALTVGAIGIFTLGMMARVARGHTGRQIDVTSSITLSFVLVNLAVVFRVFGPLLLPDVYGIWVDLSAGLWVLAFLLFAWQYLPMLVRSRIDGQPG